MQHEIITSRKNPRILSAALLSDKKQRDKSGLFFTEGRKLLDEMLLTGIRIKELYYTQRAYERYEELVLRAHDAGASLFCVTDEVYAKLSQEKNPEGFFAVAEKFEVLTSAKASPKYRSGFLVLDGVQNPSNIGTAVRTACALGIPNILLSSDCADIFGPKAMRAAMGALFRVNFCVCGDICAEILRMKNDGIRFFAAALDENAEDIRNVDFSESDCIVVGNEGSGIRDDVLLLCDKKVIVPMQMGAESLNASSAAAILMWEKQRRVIS